MKKMMKNLCSVAILLAMVLTMMPVVAFAADGDLTETNGVYEIGNVEQLKTFNTMMAGGNTFEGKIVKLTADIIYNDVSTFADWGTTAPTNQWTAAGVKFLGTFDGQGHTITGFYMAATDKEQGMFSALGGTVKNVSFVKAYVNAGTKGYVGTIVGKGVADRAMSIQNVSVEVTLIGGAGNIGGIVASTNECNKTVTITNCSVSGSITSTGASNAGIVGLASGTNEKITIRNCVNYADINLSATNTYSGGIVGQLNPTAIIENLRSTLDFSQSQSIAQSLFDIYSYMLDQIADASIMVDTKPIDNAIRAFMPIKNAWDSISVEAQQEASSKRTKEQLDIDLNHDNNIAKGYI